jgi:RHS repeat-associated protein
MALVKATTGTVSANYEYGPFGEVLRVSGVSAKGNTFRFSTKRANDASDLILYEYRAYSPATGRWPSRDPLGEQGGVNGYAFARNYPVGEIDLLGLLAASVQSIEYRGHGSTEKNGTIWQYVAVDDDINKGQIPLNVTDAKPAASVTATLDDGFNARIVAWTALSRDSGITALQMSTDLNGTIRVCCPCPFKKVRANWSARAALSGTAGLAHARFDNEKEAKTAWNRPSVTLSGVKDKALDTSSYCTTFRFVIGQGWTDVSKRTPTTSTVRVQATFECVE